MNNSNRLQPLFLFCGLILTACGGGDPAANSSMPALTSTSTSASTPTPTSTSVPSDVPPCGIEGSGIRTQDCGAVAQVVVDSSYGTNGLSEPATGYPVALAVDYNDANGYTYSLLSASMPCGDIGCVWGPYSIARRANDGSIDTGFADGGYANSFQNSSFTQTNQVLQDHYWRGLCIDPTNHGFVLVGVVPNGFFIERLNPPPAGSGVAALDVSFNAADTPGTLTIPVFANAFLGAPPQCRVSGDRTILIAGVSNNSNSADTRTSEVVVAKISADGTLVTGFGDRGLARVSLADDSGHALVVRVSSLDANPNSSSADVLIAGDAYAYFGQNSPTTEYNMVMAVNRCTGALDTNFNGSGALLYPTYNPASFGTAGWARVLTNGFLAAVFFNFPDSGLAPYVLDQIVYPYPYYPNGTPFSVMAGMLAPPAGTHGMWPGGTITASGAILLKGTDASNREVLLKLVGDPRLGFTPGLPAGESCP